MKKRLLCLALCCVMVMTVGPGLGGASLAATGLDSVTSGTNVTLTSGSSAPTEAQLASSRTAMATAAKDHKTELASGCQTAASSGHLYSGDKGTPLDSWAVREVGMAETLGLMPGEVSDRFQESITRRDFAALIHAALLCMTGMTESQLQTAVTPRSFPDCSVEKVGLCAGLGIISGTDTGMFLPDKGITRQEAAAMLSRLAVTVGAKGRGTVLHFSDVSGLWSESAINTVSTLKDSFTGNAVMGGTGGSSFSPQGGYSRQQALVTIVRLCGTAATSAPAGSYEAVSDGVEAKVSALGADGSLSNEDVEALLTFTTELEAKGDIKDVVVDGTSVLYTTADGTPSGLVIDETVSTEGGEAALGSGGGLTTENLALTASDDAVYLENNKVLFISAFAKSDAAYNTPLLEGVQAIRDKGYEVTVQNSASLRQFATMRSGDYGMVFLVAHGSVVGGQSYICAEADETAAVADEKYLINGQVRMIDHIPLRDFGVYQFSREYYITPSFFTAQLKQDPLDNAYVQLISCMSMKNNAMANAFLASGAKAVTGYTDIVRVSYAAKALSLTAEKLTPAAHTPDGTDTTVGQLEENVFKTQGLLAFNHKSYNTKTKLEETRPVLTRFETAGAEDMILAVNNAPNPTTDAGLSLTAELYSKTGSGYYGTQQFLKVTVTNHTNQTVNAFRMAMGTKEPTLEQKRDSLGVMYETGGLAPGASYTFETADHMYDYDTVWIFVICYWVGNHVKFNNYQNDIRVDIDPEDMAVLRVEAK